MQEPKAYAKKAREYIGRISNIKDSINNISGPRLRPGAFAKADRRRAMICIKFGNGKIIPLEELTVPMLLTEIIEMSARPEIPIRCNGMLGENKYPCSGIKEHMGPCSHNLHGEDLWVWISAKF